MTQPEKRAAATHRQRLGERGMARFEVVGLDSDRALIRRLAKHLAEGGMSAAQLRAEISQKVAGETPQRGGILAALRRSPLVGADLKPVREETPGREPGL